MQSELILLILVHATTKKLRIKSNSKLLLILLVSGGVFDVLLIAINKNDTFTVQILINAMFKYQLISLLSYGM